MAKIETDKSGVKPEVKGERESRWEAFVNNYKAKNPVKFAGKKARGEFDKIPDSFK